MKLTFENKATIDSKTYEQLLSHYRFAPVGDPWFEGETGKYWSERMTDIRRLPGGQSEHVRSSKTLGWSK